jgi:hypothetical protein
LLAFGSRNGWWRRYAAADAKSGKGNPRTRTINIIRRREERRGEKRFGARANETRIGEEEPVASCQGSRALSPELAWGTLNVTRSDDVATLDLCPVKKKSAKPNFHAFSTSTTKDIVGE